MNKLIYLLFLIVLFSACGEKETKKEEVAEKLVLEKTSYRLESGIPTVEIKIPSGNGDYRVTSSNEDIALAFTRSNSLIIAGLKSGNATISVKDRLGQEGKIDFTVAPNFQPAEDNSKLVYVEKGKNKMLGIPAYLPSYGYKYTNGAVASLAVKDEKLTTTGKTDGMTYAFLTNANGFLLSNYCLKVVPSYDLDFIVQNPVIHYPFEYLFVIKSGAGNYTVTADEGAEFVDKYSIEKYVFADNVIEPQLSNPAYLYVKTKAFGTTKLRVTDAAGHSTVLTLQIKYLNAKPE